MSWYNNYLEHLTVINLMSGCIIFTNFILQFIANKKNERN